MTTAGQTNGSRRRARKTWRFLFRSDSLALNLVATVAGPTMRPAGTERLTEPPLLQRWMCEADLPALAEPPDEDNLAAARVLREAVFRIADGRIKGRTPEPDDIAIINAAARAGTPPIRLGHDGLTAIPPEDARFDEVLGLIARDAIDVFSGPFRDRIKQCASPRCPIYFVDRSRAGNRQWCAMSPCGDQAAARAYRRRRASERDKATADTP